MVLHDAKRSLRSKGYYQQSEQARCQMRKGICKLYTLAMSYHLKGTHQMRDSMVFVVVLVGVSVCARFFFVCFALLFF